MEKSGIVIKSTGSWFQVCTPEGVVHDCKIKGKFRIQGIRHTNPVAVGDEVYFKIDQHDTGLIYKIKERKNYIVRKSTKLSKASHIIAANIDFACLVVTLALPRTTRGFIDRFLVTAEAYHIPSVLIFNKIDLYQQEQLDLLQHLTGIYENLGYRCFSVSAIKGDGLDHLKEFLKGKVSLFSGHSGVGKTALLNAMDDTMQLKTGDISAVHMKGKHTTTFAEWLNLNFGATIIDTPGIKEFGLYDFEKEEVAERFPEFRDYMHACKFHNCTHVHEPQCAVKQAVEEGEIDPIRYKNYLGIINDEYFDIKEYD